MGLRTLYDEPGEGSIHVVCHICRPVVFIPSVGQEEVGMNCWEFLQACRCPSAFSFKSVF